MTSLRAWILTHRNAAALLLALALIVKLLVPSGFMPAVTADRTLTISVCTGYGPATTTITLPGKGSEGTGHGEGDGVMKHDPCAYSSLNAPVLGAADPVLLIAALLFAFALALLPHAVPVVRGFERPRPPLRGPPAAF